MQNFSDSLQSQFLGNQDQANVSNNIKQSSILLLLDFWTVKSYICEIDTFINSEQLFSDEGEVGHSLRTKFWDFMNVEIQEMNIRSKRQIQWKHFYWIIDIFEDDKSFENNVRIYLLLQ